MEFEVGGTRVRLVEGDITDQGVDVVVNAANPSLMGGGGVDGAIHRRGGPRILEECRRIRREEWPGGLPTGKAVMTTGGSLRARYVIHTVGPIWRGGGRGEAELLAEAYANSLEMVASRRLKSVAFPSISTGAYGYPLEEASRVALRAVKGFLEENKDLEEVRFVLLGRDAFEVYGRSAMEVFGAAG